MSSFWLTSRPDYGSCAKNSDDLGRPRHGHGHGFILAKQSLIHVSNWYLGHVTILPTVHHYMIWHSPLFKCLLCLKGSVRNSWKKSNRVKKKKDSTYFLYLCAKENSKWKLKKKPPYFHFMESIGFYQNQTDLLGWKRALLKLSSWDLNERNLLLNIIKIRYMVFTEVFIQKSNFNFGSMSALVILLMIGNKRILLCHWIKASCALLKVLYLIFHFVSSMVGY